MHLSYYKKNVFSCFSHFFSLLFKKLIKIISNQFMSCLRNKHIKQTQLPTIKKQNRKITATISPVFWGIIIDYFAYYRFFWYYIPYLLLFLTWYCKRIVPKNLTFQKILVLIFILYLPSFLLTSYHCQKIFRTISELVLQM